MTMMTMVVLFVVVGMVGGDDACDSDDAGDADDDDANTGDTVCEYGDDYCDVEQCVMVLPPVTPVVMLMVMRMRLLIMSLL